MNNSIIYKPTIPNSHISEKKYITIHSEDRDILKYPSSSQFEIMLPQQYNNVQNILLSSWSFPANYSTFSELFNNITLYFQLTQIYKPKKDKFVNSNKYNLECDISDILNKNKDNTYKIIIESGFYTPDQLALELTNRMNNVVTEYLKIYLEKTNLDLFNNTCDGYNQFKVIYHEVAHKLWFGNKSSGFKIINNSSNYDSPNVCLNKYSGFDMWGLPAYLGFTKNDAQSIKYNDNEKEVIRLYYGEHTGGDNGYWLEPDLPEASVYAIKTPFTLNILGQQYFYLDLDEFNNIDETKPYELSKYSMQQNNTNGVVNSAFAKIAVASIPLTQWFDSGSDTYKWFNPPLENLKKIKVKLRYHNGQLVNFGNMDYSFVLELTTIIPQHTILKSKY
jgi:hypothetical protein